MMLHPPPRPPPPPPLLDDVGPPVLGYAAWLCLLNIVATLATLTAYTSTSAAHE